MLFLGFRLDDALKNEIENSLEYELTTAETVIEFLDNKQPYTDTNLEFYTVEELDKEVENITNEIYKFIKLQ